MEAACAPRYYAKLASGLALDEPIGVHTFPEPIDLRDLMSVAAFEACVRDARFPVPLVAVAIDTYAAATPGASENSSEDTTTTMVHARRISEQLGVTVLLVHHTNAIGSRERGHSAMRGAADFMISMTPVDDAIHVECSKQRNAAPFEKLLLKLVPLPDGDGCVLRLATDVLPSALLTPAQDKALAILRETFGPGGATKAEWLRACNGIAERTFFRAASQLQTAGFVRAAAGRFFAKDGV